MLLRSEPGTHDKRKSALAANSPASRRVRECVRLKWNYSPHDTRTDGPNATTLSFYYNQ
jgi:hypothetical protein